MKKFFDKDDLLKAKETLPDALLQRLMVKIQKYRIEEKNGDPIDVVKDGLDFIKQGASGAGIAAIPKVYEYLHIFECKQLANDNDPATALSDLTAYDTKEKWLDLITKSGE